MRKLLLAALFTSVSACGAMAADAIDEVPFVDVPAGFSWTGAYIGVQAGYGWGNADHVTGAPTIMFGENNVDGWLLGAYVGYNYQFSNNVVVGADADIAWSNQDGGPNRMTARGVPLVGNTITTDITWSGAVRARLGYAVDRFLPYIAGGVGFAKTESFYNFGAADGRIEEVMTGWTIGGGVDYAVTDNLIFRAEYRYSDFGSETQQPFLPAFPQTQKVSLDSHDIRIGLSYKF